VYKGMWLGDAFACCPHLCVLPYDFVAYEQVSKQIFAIFVKYTPFVQVVSCDEALLDLTALRDIARVEHCVRMIRDEVVAVTGCTCSAGIGSNPLLARLALRQAKANGPNQQHTAPSLLERDRLLDWLSKLSVTALPGVGFKSQQKLQQLGYELIGDLQRADVATLQREFGVRHGRLLWEMARGIDKTPLKLFHERKSISVEVTYGVRFTEPQKVFQFVTDVAAELIRRMVAANVRGRCITLTVYQKCDDVTTREDVVENSEESEDSGDIDNETPNFSGQKAATISFRSFYHDVSYLGHGRCVKKSRSRSLAYATANAELITSTCLTLYKEFQLQPQQLRGLAIQMKQLESVNVKLNRVSSRLHTFFQRPLRGHYSVATESIATNNATTQTNTETEIKMATKTQSDQQPVSNETRDNPTQVNDRHTAACASSSPPSSLSTLPAGKKGQSDCLYYTTLCFAEERFSDVLRTSFVVWLQKTTHPQRIHIELVQHYLTFLALVEKNLEDVHLILMTFQQQSKLLPQWQQPFKEILECTQRQITYHYGAPLQLST